MNLKVSFRKRKQKLYKKLGLLIEEPIINTCLDIQEMDTYKIEVVLYLSGGKASAYQGNMWFNVLERINANVAVVIREKSINNGLMETSLPVFFCKTLRDIELLEKAGVKTILYAANAQKVAQSLRLYRLNHYFINHGESDKVVNQSKLLMAYDKLLVAGPIAKKRMLDAGLPLRDDQVEFVGRPQVELTLDKCTEPLTKEGLLKILYAPTWEGFVEEANYSSVNQYGYDMLNTLMQQENVMIYFKPHPFTGRVKESDPSIFIDKIKKLFNNTKHVIVDDNKGIHEYMNLCDVMITDISSTIVDYLYTLKPMILTNPRSQSKEDVNSDYYSSNATYFLEKAIDINQLIDSIKEEDVMLSKRKSISSDILGDIEEGYMAKFNSVINKSLEKI